MDGNYITLQDLKERERVEYEELQHLLQSINRAEQKNDNVQLDSLNKVYSFQRGRWGMIIDLMEDLLDETE